MRSKSNNLLNGYDRPSDYWKDMEDLENISPTKEDGANEQKGLSRDTEEEG